MFNVARELLSQVNLLPSFSGDCVLMAGYLINRTPLSISNGKTPFEMLYSKPLDYSSLRTFGCLCYVHNATSDKFHSRSRKCIFLGYPLGKRDWRIFDLQTHKFLISRDVTFFEHIFPYGAPTTIENSILLTNPPVPQSDQNSPNPFTPFDDYTPGPKLVSRPTVISPSHDLSSTPRLTITGQIFESIPSHQNSFITPHLSDQTQPPSLESDLSPTVMGPSLSQPIPINPSS